MKLRPCLWENPGGIFREEEDYGDYRSKFAGPAER